MKRDGKFVKPLTKFVKVKRVGKIMTLHANSDRICVQLAAWPKSWFLYSQNYTEKKKNENVI